MIADVGVAASSILLDSGSSGSRRPEGRVRDFNLAGTGSVGSSRPTEKEVGILVGSSGGTTAGVGDRGGGVSRPMLPKMTFWFVVGRSCTGAEENLF